MRSYIHSNLLIYFSSYFSCKLQNYNLKISWYSYKLLKYGKVLFVWIYPCIHLYTRCVQKVRAFGSSKIKLFCNENVVTLEVLSPWQNTLGPTFLPFLKAYLLLSILLGTSSFLVLYQHKMFIPHDIFYRSHKIRWIQMIVYSSNIVFGQKLARNKCGVRRCTVLQMQNPFSAHNSDCVRCTRSRRRFKTST